MSLLAFLGLHFDGHFSVGDVLVFIGAVAAAWYTARLGHIAVDIDQKTVDRDEDRRQRNVRGIARVVDGDLGVVAKTLQTVIDDNGAWSFGASLEHGTWRRDGAVLVETLPEAEARALVEVFARIGAIQTIIDYYGRRAKADIQRLEKDGLATIQDIVDAIEKARVLLRPVAYPDEIASA